MSVYGIDVRMCRDKPPHNLKVAILSGNVQSGKPVFVCSGRAASTT
jgi:hypothetical protein